MPLSPKNYVTELEPAPNGTRRFAIDTDKAYPAMLAELGVAEDAISRYWLEVCYQCVKMDVQHFLGFREGMAKPMEFRFNAADKEKWRLANYPGPVVGKDIPTIDHDPEVRKATQGRMAREHYRRLRGFIPG